MFGRSDSRLCCGLLEPAVLDVDWMHAGPKIEYGGGLETVELGVCQSLVTENCTEDAA